MSSLGWGWAARARGTPRGAPRPRPRFESVLFCKGWDLDVDRVVMILPQVHLRNVVATVLIALACRGHSLCETQSVLKLHDISPEGHFRPLLPMSSSAFAGDGLNIRRVLGLGPGASQPLQSLNVRHLTGASLRITHCCIFDVVTIREGVTLAAAPALSRPAAVVKALGLSRTV